MKKILNKIFKRKTETLSSRITSDTVAEHRERVLAGGRKFKYPIQYARHKLIINAVIISLLALIIMIVIGWWRLYVVQSTSRFIYNVTKVLPVPVANIDGQPVLYSDYLMKYLSCVHYSQNKEQLNINSEDGKRQLQYYKQQSIDGAIADAFAKKLSIDMDISVSDSEVEEFIVSSRKSNEAEMTEVAYQAVISDYFGWSPSEYRHITKNNLIRQKVSYLMDEEALDLANDISTRLIADSKIDFKKLVETESKTIGKNLNYSISGWVPKSNQDGGRAAEASTLEKSQISSVLKSTTGDGYYIIRLLDSTKDQVSYEYIEIPLTAFDNMLKKIIDDNKLEKYIEI